MLPSAEPIEICKWGGAAGTSAAGLASRDETRRPQIGADAIETRVRAFLSWLAGRAPTFPFGSRRVCLPSRAASLIFVRAQLQVSFSHSSRSVKLR